MSNKNVIFSERQRQAIEWDNNRELLISAAAGSGKTTVLINRIIDRIVNKRIPIDCFLVVTYTHASANELKERLCLALEKQLALTPDDEWLSLQLANVTRASIGTMHSFCLKVIKEFHSHPAVMLPKSVRILSDEKKTQLFNEAVDEIFTDEYQRENNTKFTAMLDIYASFRNDFSVRELVKELYEFSLNNEEPYKWIENLKNGGMADYADGIYGFMRKTAEETKHLCEYTFDNFKSQTAKTSYSDDLLLVIKKLEKYIACIDNKDYSAADKIINEEFDFINLKGGRVKDEAVIVQKNVLKYIKNGFLSFAAINYDIPDMNVNMQGALSELCHVTVLVGERFKAKKLRAKSVDYSDMEHMVLELFKDDSVAGIYRSKFKHIMFDEYQDCNRLQEKIVQKIAGEAKYFMVGDIKQSIYSFRQAAPELFLEKYNNYKYDENADHAVIELNENYRSRSNVLNAVNRIFFSIMTKDFCGMEYNAKNALNAMASYPECSEKSFADEPVRLALMNGKNLRGQPSYEAQTLYIIDSIKKMVGNNYVYDAKSNAYRPIRYSDIAILLRATKSGLGIIKSSFAFADIPVNIMQDEDIKYVPEVNLLICLLQCIENPYNDIALMTVLHSYIFGVTDNQLASIMNARLDCGRELISKVTAYISKAESDPMNRKKNGIDDLIYTKLKRFVTMLEQWTVDEKSMPIADFIDTLLDETAYMEYFGAFENGEQRKDNVQRLYNALKQQLDSTSGGLYECIRILKSIDEKGFSGAPASIEDAVSVMSIHKSKGLEFPVVFLMDAGNSFSSEEIRGTVLMHKDYGIVSEAVDSQNRIKYNTHDYELLKLALRKEQREEEQRILYVAMTRAKEQLIIVGTMSQSTADYMYMGRSLLETASANNYLKWIFYGLCADYADVASPLSANMLAENTFSRQISGTDYDSLWNVEICNVKNDSESGELICSIGEEDVTLRTLGKKKRRDNINTENAAVYRDNTLEDYDDLIKKLSYKYPFENATKINSKMSVSQIKHIMQNELDNDENEIPDYRYDKVKVISLDENMTPVRLGTLYHFFMQHAGAVYPYGEQNFKNDVANMLSKKLITEQESRYLKARKFTSYFNSEIGKRIANAKFVEREKSFSYFVSADKIFSDVDSDEKILVQGVIDCYFCDKNGKYVLIDYKTDSVGEGMESELIKKHSKQIELYKSTLHDIMNIEISEAYIYSFALEKFIAVD